MHWHIAQSILQAVDQFQLVAGPNNDSTVPWAGTTAHAKGRRIISRLYVVLIKTTWLLDYDRPLRDARIESPSYTSPRTKSNRSVYSKPFPATPSLRKVPENNSHGLTSHSESW